MKWVISVLWLCVDIKFFIVLVSLYVLYCIYFLELISLINGKDYVMEWLEVFKYFIGVVELFLNYDEYEEFKSIVNEYLEKLFFSF